MHIQDIRNKALFEEIDYLFLKDTLKEYAEPRSKIRSFLKSKALIRIKKGLYIFGPEAARGPYCKELLANLIYGPSAISLEYALGYYGLIPERVEELTCITTRRNKHFSTPVGRFSYHHLHLRKYPPGIIRTSFPGNRFVLMASKEKALCDMLTLKLEPLENEAELKHYLFEDLRLEENLKENFDVKEITELASYYQNKNVDLLKNVLNKIIHKEP